MSQDKNKNQIQEQVKIIRTFEEKSVPKKVFNANESGPKEGTETITRNRDNNTNRN